MKILYQLFRGRSGGDVYFERLSESMSHSNIETKIKYYPQRLEMAPFLIKSNFKNIKPYDIVHSNVDAGFAFKVKSKPLVVTAHHLVFNPLYQHYTSISQKLFHKALFLYTKKSLNSADFIIAVSENTKREIEAVFGITDVKVIYNGIDTDIFKPLHIDDPCPDKIKLFFVGNLTKRKGADLLPRIMDKLDDRFVLFYTSGLRTKKDFTKKKMISLNKLSLSELIQMYNFSNILIAPSRLEGFGYSVAEAMACEKPVVATNCSSFPELIDDSKGGFLCEMDNVNDFVEKIEILGNDENLRITMGKYNRNKMLNYFNMNNMGKQYEKLYKSIV